MRSFLIRLKVAQAEVIFPLVVKQTMFFLRLHRHFPGSTYLLNIIGCFESLNSKPVPFIKNANHLCLWIEITWVQSWIFFFPFLSNPGRELL